MALPSTTEDLLALLDMYGWSTSAFRRSLDFDEWPAALRMQHLYVCPPAQYPSPPLPPQQQQQRRQEGHASLMPQQQQLRPTTDCAAIARSSTTCPSNSAVRISDVVAREAALAYGRIRPYVRQTPLEPSLWLSSLVRPEAGSGPTGGGCTALLKLESEQHTGSFKVRGALSKLLSLPPDALTRGVVTASTGNHALAVLYACAALSSAAAAATIANAAPTATSAQSSPVRVAEGTEGACSSDGAVAPPLRPKLYVPTTASSYKVRKLTSLGGELHQHGTDCLEAELAARAAADASGAVYVSPYNDPWVMAGQGTLALELLASRRRGQLDVVLVPVGGGGLIGGVASVLKAADPSIHVVGCQPAASDVMARSVAAGAIVPELDDGGEGGVSTLSDATAGGIEYGSSTLQPCMDCVDEWVTLSEAEIAEALVRLLEEESKLVEGAAACSLAAFWRLASRLAGKHVVVVCCGGNIALPALRRAIAMVRPEH